jgi:WD40-like Beta Propeller Repeat
MAGETLDPFNPANGTLNTLLRRVLVREPELNPAALFDVPPLFFFLRSFLALSIFFWSLLTFGRAKSAEVSYAGFLVTLILLSPNTASYTFLLLLLPIALLLGSAGRRYRIILLLCYSLLSLPMRPWWNWLFPKVWLLVAMLWAAWAVSGQLSRRRTLVASLAVAAAVSVVIAGIGTTAYGRETDRRWQRLAVEPGALYSSRPIPLNDGLVYQSIKHGAYTLRIRRGGALRDFAVEGNAFNPELLGRGNLVRFESVRDGMTRRLIMDLANQVVSLGTNEDLTESADLARSPDRKWIVCERTSWGQKQLYLTDQIHNGEPIQVTEGLCNSFAPAWEPDGKAIVFASDCGRGVGMPALYRAALEDMLMLTR